MRSTKREVSPEHLATFYHLPLHEVAQRLGICTTALKKLCRRRGIDRWPYRRLRSIQRVVQRKTHKLRNASVTETLALQRELEELSVQRQTILSTLFYPPSSSSSSHRFSDSDSDDHADVHEDDKDDSDSDEEDAATHHSDVRTRDPLRSLLHVIESNGRTKRPLPSPPVPNASRFAFPPPSSSALHHGLSYNHHHQQQASAPTAFSTAGGFGHHAVSTGNEPRSSLPPSLRPVDLLARQQTMQQQQQQYLEQQHYQHYQQHQQQQQQHVFQAPQAPGIAATHFSTREMKNPTQHREPSVSFPPTFPQTHSLTHNQVQAQSQTQASSSMSGSFVFPTARQGTSSKMTPQAMSKSPAGSLSPHFSSSSFWTSSSSSTSSSSCSPASSPLMPESPMVVSLPPPSSPPNSSHSVLFPALSPSASAGLAPARKATGHATLPSVSKNEEALPASCSTGGQYKLPDWFNEDRQKYLCLHLAD